MEPSKAAWARVERVTVASGPGRLDVSAVRRPGEPVAHVLVEAHDDSGALACAGTIGVWELNQVIAALISGGSQARRLVVRDDGRGSPGHLDVLCDAAGVRLVATGAARTASFAGARLDLAANVTEVVRRFMAVSREARATPDVVVLPDAGGIVPAN